MTHEIYLGTRVFILEGILSEVVSIILKFLIVDWPGTASLLKERERAILIRRLAEDRACGVAKMDRLDKHAIRRIVKDWKIYIG